MEIGNIIKDKNGISDFIENEFLPVDSANRYFNAPMRVNYQCRYDNITFCGDTVAYCQALKEEGALSIYLILDFHPELVGKITKIYGKPMLGHEIEINDISIGGSCYWRSNGLDIYLSPFTNLSERNGFDNRYSLVVSTVPMEKLMMGQQEIFNYFQK